MAVYRIRAQSLSGRLLAATYPTARLWLKPCFFFVFYIPYFNTSSHCCPVSFEESNHVRVAQFISKRTCCLRFNSMSYRLAGRQCPPLCTQKVKCCVDRLDPPLLI